MDLGRFSISLAVKSIQASRAFYEKLGFKAIDGGYRSKELPSTETTDWLIMKNGDTLVGLFMGMFDRNVLTFNTSDARTIQQSLKRNGVKLINEAAPEGSGPAHFMLSDPDRNLILFDQQ